MPGNVPSTLQLWQIPFWFLSACVLPCGTNTLPTLRMPRGTRLAIGTGLEGTGSSVEALRALARRALPSSVPATPGAERVDLAVWFPE